jgi:2-polyprenyl-3-methyl-5-hydroxy-6-metoxy-1,4-benzoquinol methylase
MANRHYRPARLAYRQGLYGHDVRLEYLLYFMDVRGQRVLELGAQEGHHSIILEKLGVSELVSVEARPENLAKCNLIKQRFRLDNTSFVQHNLETLADGSESATFAPPFDLVFCCGVLYHLNNPALVLEWCRAQARTLFLGTLYYESAFPQAYAKPPYMAEAVLFHNGMRFRGLAAGEDMSHPGNGICPVSFWPAEADLLLMLKVAGYKTISVLGKDVQNQWPHITVLAEA